MNLHRCKIALVVILLLGTTVVSLVPGCGGDKFTLNPDNDSGNFDFGRMVFGVSRSYLQNTPPYEGEKVSAIDSHKDEFIRAINAIVPEEVNQNITAPLQVILPLVDDNTLPDTTNNLKKIIRLLTQHPQDPQKRTLEAMANMANSKGLGVEDWIVLLGRLVKYKEIEEFLVAVAQILRENDGLDDQGLPNNERDIVGRLLEFASRKLREQKPSPSTTITAGGSSTSSSPSVVDDLLANLPVRGGMGAKAFAVKRDIHGNPAVSIDPATGTVYYPFIDADNDGVADVNAQGEPIDQNGNVITLTPFDQNGPRDQNGRRLAAVGTGPVFKYFDAKQTYLGVILNLLGVAIDKKVPENGLALVQAILGSPIKHNNGTVDPKDDYETYTANHPLHDLIYGALEVFKHPESPKLLDSIQDLSKNNPQTTENLLLSLGKAIKLLQNANVTLSQSDINQLIDDLIPLLETITKRPNASSTSTARLLMGVIHSIGQSARNLPGQLADLIRYKNFQTKALVDFNQPAGVNNRSSLEQLLALLDNMDKCQVPLINESVSWIIVDTVAGMTPNNVQNLILQLDGILGAVAPLMNSLCPGYSDNRRSLNDLAMSGALDALIPLARIFKQRGETDLLIDILRKIYAHYPTLMRKAEPTLIKVFESGAVGNIFDVVAITTQWQVPNSQEKVADVLADALEGLLDSSKVVYRRNGQTAPRLVNLIWDPMKELEKKISQSGKGDSFTKLLTALTDYLTETVRNDNGTPNDPSDDYDQLKYPTLLPLLVKSSAKLSQSLGAAVADRQKKVSRYQADLNTFLGGRDFHALVDFLQVVEKSPSRDTIYKAVQNLFTSQVVQDKDAFGALMTVFVSLLQTQTDANSLKQMAWFVGDVMGPKRTYVKDAIRAINRIIEKDDGRFVLTVLQNLFKKENADKEPLLVVYYTVQDVYLASLGNPSQAPQWKVADLEAILNSILQFIENKNYGLDELYLRIKNRKR